MLVATKAASCSCGGDCGATASKSISVACSSGAASCKQGEGHSHIQDFSISGNINTKCKKEQLIFHYYVQGLVLPLATR